MRTLVVAIVIFGFTLGMMNAIAHESNPPYLFYFSYDEDGVVVERADGTDRRVLGEGLLQETGYGLEWSPSGRWLAWGNTTSAINGPFLEYYDVKAWVSSYDGRENISLEQWGGGNSWRWSPTEDWLLVSYSATDGPNSGFVVDISSREVFYTFDYNSNPPSWTPDGRHLQFLEGRYDVQLEDGTSGFATTLVTVSRDGERQEREVASYLYGLNHFPNERLYYLHPTRRTIIAEDIETGNTFEYPQVLFRVHEVYWGPDSQKALIFTGTSADIAGEHQQHHLWLLWGETLVPVSTDAILPHGVIYSDRAFDPYENWTVWSPDSTRASLSTMDGQVLWVWVDPYQTQTINLPPEYGRGDVVRWQWYPDGYSGLVRLGDNIWEYDLATDTFGAERIDIHPSIAISASGQNWGVIDSCEPDDERDLRGIRVNPFTVCIIDLKTGKRVSLPSAKNDHDLIESNWGGIVDWHSREEWVIFKESVSTRYPYLGYSVAHASGIVYRPLRTISPWISSIEWLPEQVPID